MLHMEKDLSPQLNSYDVTDPFSDQCKTPLIEFQGGVEISPAVLLTRAKSSADYFEKIVSSKQINERADVHFQDFEYKTIMVYGLKWHPREVVEIYVFFLYVFLMGLVKLPELVDHWSDSINCSDSEIFSSQ